MNFGQLLNTVQNNCHISDARYAGNYSMCTFLLKMREYYRWEHDIPFSEPVPKEDIGPWLIEREQAWHKLDDSSYEALPIENDAYDPFNAEAINTTLIPSGYVYSGGYGLFNKPHFSLGELSSHEHRDGADILISSCEYARDLVAPPAMLLNNTIFISKESVRRYVWERLDEWRWTNRDDVPMARAVACYSKHGDIGQALDKMADIEIASMINHEMGELKVGKLMSPEWNEMLVAISCTQAEFKARAIRDLLADCMSTLPILLTDHNEPSLHFYFGNFSGIRKMLYPQLMNAYHEWLETKNWGNLISACEHGEAHWKTAANKLLQAFQQGRIEAALEIEKIADGFIL